MKDSPWLRVLVLTVVLLATAPAGYAQAETAEVTLKVQGMV